MLSASSSRPDFRLDGSQLLIVAFLYSPPGLLRINNPQANIPEWLLPDYQSLYESVPSMPVRQEAPAPIAAPQTQQVPATDLPQPDFGVFHKPSRNCRKSYSIEPSLGLSNLYYIDPIRKSFMSSVRFVYP